MGATRLFAIAWLWLVTSCRSGAPLVAYPEDSCKADGCGRVTTLGVIGDQRRGDDGAVLNDFFFLVDLEAKDAKGSPYGYAVACSGCPLEIGKTYRARLNGEGNALHSILWDGAEIPRSFATPERADGLYLTTYDQWTCNEGPSHWEVVDGMPTCKPGPGPARQWTEAVAVHYPECSPGHPRGLGSLNFAIGSKVSILIRLSSTYALEDPVLAKEAFPQVFIDALNSREIPQDRFVLADGPPNLFFEIEFDMDETEDHYGLSILVKGPKDRATFAAGGEAVPLFRVVVPPVYKSAKLITAAATAVYERLWHGWTCDAGGATPQQTVADYCKAAGPAYTCNVE